MKNNQLFWAKKISAKVLLSGFISFAFICSSIGQVNFTQTTNADFNKGVLNNAVITGDNLELQYSANSVGNWLTTTVLPQTLSGHKTVSWNDRYVYLVGGYNNSTYSSSVYFATINSAGISNWTSLPSLPVGLKDPAVVIGTNTIYVLGGRNASQVFNSIYYAAINTDGTIGSWQTSTVTLPTALWGHTAAYVNGYIYVAGGSSVITENSALNTIHYTKVKADNSLSTFLTGTNLPAERNKHSMVTYNSTIYILGGYDNSGARANTVFYTGTGVDGSVGTWSDGTPLPLAISNHSSVVTNGLITVLAGATNTTLSNTAYYANIDQALPWTWVTSPNVMYDFTKNGSAFQGNGLVFHCGGTNLSGSPIINCRYANLALTSNYVNHGVFVSNPFFELGAERIIDSLTFHDTYNPSFANCQVSYRTALSDGIWSDWTALTETSPILVNLTRQYLQYMVILTGQNTYNVAFHEMTLSTQGSQLSGNLNGTTTFTMEQSPYWVTSDISFTGGTHTFEAGTTILFLPQTGMYVGQANIICNGTAADSVKFLYYADGSGLWKGIRFDPNSDNGVSSQFNYTVIADAGYPNGTNKANLVCDQTNEPYLQNCNLRNAEGNGILLYYSHIILQNTVLNFNTQNGIYLDNSNPTFVSCAISNNGGAGVYLTSTNSQPTYSATVIDHNLYGFHYPSPNFSFTQPLGSPTLTDNTYNGVAMDGGDIMGSPLIWNAISYDYFLLGTIRIIQPWAYVRLTIEPGNTIKALPEVQIQVGGYHPWYGNVCGGELYALGTADNMITFTAANGQSGGWNGICFTDYSDNWGGHSQLDYCIIEKGNEYNYFAGNTIQPDEVNHCTIQDALIDGARYSSSSGIISNCQFLNNGRYPVYLMNLGANPTRTNNNYSGNSINYIALSGGDLNENRTFYNDGIPYHVLDNIRILYRRITLRPGVTLAFDTGKNFQVGNDSYGIAAELYAEGNSDSLITFKPYNDSIGGWGGMYFHNYSDEYGSMSTLKYCKIEKGANYNIYCNSTSQPQLHHCEITQSSGVGIQLNSSSIIIDSCNISNSGSHGIVEQSSSSQIHYCQFLNNNGYPLRYNDWSCNSHLLGNSYSGNALNYIALSGGDSWDNRTIYNDGIPYHVLGNIRIAIRRLTIKPGVTMAFESGKNLQVGNDSYGIAAELYAEGNSDSLITFKPYNDSIGGWGGMYFHNYSDEYGSMSTLKYCKIEKGANYNIYCNSTSQPQLHHCEITQSSGVGIQLNSSSPIIDSCTISNSASHGIVEQSSSAQIHYCQFLNNNGYPLRYNDWSCNSHLLGNSYSGNALNYIALSGGDSWDNRTIYNDGIPYHVLDNIRIAIRRLTIKPGVTMFFESGKNLQVGIDWYGWPVELYAEGNSDSLISFQPINDSIGGWGGIFFIDPNDNYGGTSSLKYCKIEKGANYNILCQSSTQPTIEHCILNQSTGDGLNLYYSPIPPIKNSWFSNNLSNGISLHGNSYPIIGNDSAYICNFFNNGGYNVYNNTGYDINARYNYWASGDSTMIAAKIYDKSDNSSLGKVLFNPFVSIPSLIDDSTSMSGTLIYANSLSSPLDNAALVIKNFSGTTIASCTTNSNGEYFFGPFPSGVYKMSINTEDSWAGVNSTDALGILNHFLQINPLMGMKRAASDVNKSAYINGTDALLVLLRFVNQISSFPAGDYLFDSDTVSINGSHVTNNIKLLNFGDVNASYAPQLKNSTSVTLIQDGFVEIPSFTEFNLPVKMKYGAEIGAISLGLYYPADYIEIVGAELVDSSSNFYFSIEDGLIRLAWCDTEPLIVADEENIITLKVRSLNLTGSNQIPSFELYENSEFADKSGVPLNGVVLEIPEIKPFQVGVQESVDEFALRVYPNPFRDHALITFTLSQESRVKMVLYNTLGEEMNQPVEMIYPKGQNQLEMNTPDLTPGIYLLKIAFTSNGQTSSKILKVVVSN